MSFRCFCTPNSGRNSYGGIPACRENSHSTFRKNSSCRPEEYAVFFYHYHQWQRKSVGYCYGNEIRSRKNCALDTGEGRQNDSSPEENERIREIHCYYCGFNRYCRLCGGNSERKPCKLNVAYCYCSCGCRNSGRPSSRHYYL